MLISFWTWISHHIESSHIPSVLVTFWWELKSILFQRMKRGEASWRILVRIYYKRCEFGYEWKLESPHGKKYGGSMKMYLSIGSSTPHPHWTHRKSKWYHHATETSALPCMTAAEILNQLTSFTRWLYKILKPKINIHGGMLFIINIHLSFTTCRAGIIRE